MSSDEYDQKSKSNGYSRKKRRKSRSFEDESDGYDTRSEVASSVGSWDGSRRRVRSPIPPLRRNSPAYVQRLRPLLRDARYFLIKSNNVENVELSKQRGVWATLPQTRRKLSAAFREVRNVLLIFSVKESGKFAGMARMSSDVDGRLSPVRWMSGGVYQFDELFRVDWITRNEVPFAFTEKLYNRCNRHLPVKVGRDGQEVDEMTGRRLCELFPEDTNVNLDAVLKKSRKDSVKKRLHKRSSGRRSRGRSEERRSRRHERRRSIMSFESFVKSRPPVVGLLPPGLYGMPDMPPYYAQAPLPRYYDPLMENGNRYSEREEWNDDCGWNRRYRERS